MMLIIAETVKETLLTLNISQITNPSQKFGVIKDGVDAHVESERKRWIIT